MKVSQTKSPHDGLLPEEREESENSEARTETFLVENEKSARWYVLFALLRFFMVIVPQYGYIHPDELIQSVEVVGGQILKADAEIAWEFNRTNPIRSLNVPFLVNGTPIWILKHLSMLTEMFFDTNIITPFTILVSARLVMCTASFLVDYSMYKICQIYSRPYQNKLTILASSYVMLVYVTRTFSNSVELILFSVLLWMIAACLHDHQLLVHFRKYLLEISNGLESARSRVKHLKVIRSIQEHNLQHCFLISSLMVIGCYNRPTFVVFGVGPLFFWIHRGLSSEYITVKDIHLRMLNFLISAVPLLIIFVLSDSFYYGYLTIAEIRNWDITIKKFVFPPWNFVKYNLNSENLAEYGIHARYLHFLVNLPLLFGTLGIVMFGCWATSAYKFIKKPSLSGHSRALDIDNLMRVSLFVPIALLSLLPHQEPRFIIPIILPITFLYGDRIFTISRNWQQLSKIIFNSWIIFNCLMSIVFGIVHQAGVVHFANFLHREIQTESINTTFHIFTSHMYNFPRVLLNQPNPNIIFRSEDGVWFQKRRRVNYHEERGKSMRQVVENIEGLHRFANAKDISSHPIVSYVAIPSALKHSFEFEIETKHIEGVSEMGSLYPHLTTEVFENSEAFHVQSNESIYETVIAVFSKIFDLISVTIYRVG